MIIFLLIVLQTPNVFSRGRLAQWGEHSLTTPAIQVQIQAEPRLRPWQKNHATLTFQKSYSNKITGQTANFNSLNYWHKAIRNLNKLAL